MKSVVTAFCRRLLRRKALTALELLSTAVGVCAAIGMALSARTALSSFERAVDFLNGRATHTLQAAAGTLDEQLLARLLRDPALEAFAPVIDRRVVLATGAGARLLGVDPFLDRDIRPWAAEGREGPSLDVLLEPASVLAGENLARELGVRAGDTVATSRGRLRVLGTFPDGPGEPLLLMDVGHAQELFGLRGALDRVDLVLSDAPGFRARWRGYRVSSAQEHRATFGDLLRAFRLNLEALSLLGLFVGVFLVYNTATFTVASRRRDAGILMSLGVRRRELSAAFLVEVLLLGAAGGAAGAALGFGLARLLTGLVGATISNLYFFLRPTPPEWSWTLTAWGVALGVAASLTGAAFPLVELVRVDPVSALSGRAPRRESRTRAVRSAAAGAAVLAAGGVLLLLGQREVYAGFGGAFLLLLGASLFSGCAVLAAGPLLSRTFRRAAGLIGQLAAGNLLQNLGRTSVAAAAFMVALSMAVGLGLMIGSFRRTVVWWMEGQLTGDLYVASSSDVEVPEDFYNEIRSLPGLGGVDPYRNVQLLYRGTPIRVSAVDASVLRRFARFGWLTGGDDNWDRVAAGGVIVSESFQRRFGVGPGGEVELEGAAGPVRLRVAASFYDYTTEHGLVMMDRTTYLSVFGDRALDSFSVFGDPRNPDTPRLLEEVKRRAARKGIPVVTRGQLHGKILGVFDATFSVTRAMRLLTVIVAFFGIAGALLTLHMERRKDFGIYRALGFSARQVAGMTLAEGIGIGLLSLAMSTVVGTALAWVLIRVINLQSFHWTIFFHPAPGPYLAAAATSLLASLGAALLPLWRALRTFPHAQLRED
ncbi:MAG: FtsX-like permease family protein [Deltaproteobacteria bacterium]|nr:FtsX-like permease family protein [Deltaproteobacteria bacterium]